MAHARGDRLRRRDGFGTFLQDMARHQRVALFARNARGKLSQAGDTALDQRGRARGLPLLPRGAQMRSFDQRLEVESDLLRRLIPSNGERPAVLDCLLRRAGDKGGNSPGLQPRAAARIEHFLAPRRERHQLFAADPPRFEIAVLERRAGLVAELLDARAKARHRDRIEERVQGPQPVVLESAPDAVGSARHIGDDRMEMQIGLLIAVRVVLEKTDREIAGGDRAHLPFLHEPGFGGILFRPRRASR